MTLSLSRTDLFREQAVIGGSWRDAASGATETVVDPATGAAIGSVPKMGADETTQAIDAAAAAFPGWAATSAKERAVILKRWADLMVAHADDLARIMTAEQGKPVPEARGEVLYGASFIEWFAEEGRRVYGDTIPSPWGDRRIVAIKQPIGVTAAITPWNFPNAMLARKAGPALAAGCTMVAKPAGQTPYSMLAMAVLAEEAGLPPGVLNIVTGDARAIGGVMTASPIVQKISFTGSTEVGRVLMRQSADTIKKLSLELGGNAPFIVFDDPDLDKAVEGAMVAKFRNNGQTCVCANRIYVQAGVYDAFAEKLVAAVKKLKVGNGFDAGVTLGPLIDEKAVAKVREHLDDAVAKGATVLTGGNSLGGNFIAPAVVADVTPEMIVSREETFGPLAPLIRFSTEDEAIRLANDTEFGLASYFYSRDIGRVWRVGEKLEYGIVGINTGLISTAEAPFGGVKQSGLGARARNTASRTIWRSSISAWDCDLRDGLSWKVHLPRDAEAVVDPGKAATEAVVASGHQFRTALPERRDDPVQLLGVGAVGEQRQRGREAEGVRHEAVARQHRQAPNHRPRQHHRPMRPRSLRTVAPDPLDPAARHHGHIEVERLLGAASNIRKGVTCVVPVISASPSRAGVSGRPGVTFGPQHTSAGTAR
ncbi:Succinate-semialdehyde dehydrogenase [NADP(+)] GabD [Methylobrevis pamukkalensis]|uniref:Succinate-semialdehyde dehydrogenase [NADP(+)] GabD n=1 Tax=Methylobrevis pamukkalensis TaxID=1439726 RepID=A0A1E3H6T3_9HYPH|nr:Succinate-semialdehyde dehydrogenase [NADP(+)] GabD [Methylobrevis pamukkalensis]